MRKGVVEIFCRGLEKGGRVSFYEVYFLISSGGGEFGRVVFWIVFLLRFYFRLVWFFGIGVCIFVYIFGNWWGFRIGLRVVLVVFTCRS